MTTTLEITGQEAGEIGQEAVTQTAEAVVELNELQVLRLYVAIERCRMAGESEALLLAQRTIYRTYLGSLSRESVSVPIRFVDLAIACLEADIEAGQAILAGLKGPESHVEA